MAAAVAAATLSSNSLSHCPRLCRWIDFNQYEVSWTTLWTLQSLVEMLAGLLLPPKVRRQEILHLDEILPR